VAASSSGKSSHLFPLELALRNCYLGKILTKIIDDEFFSSSERPVRMIFGRIREAEARVVVDLATKLR
jgi:hypothetical protein